MQTYNEPRDATKQHNDIVALNILLESVHKLSKELDDRESQQLKDAYSTLCYYLGSQAQYLDFKNNY